MPELVLLTHATETARLTNTGRLVQSTADTIGAKASGWQVRTVLWQRKTPDPGLLQSLQNAAAPSYVLLYPSATETVIDADKLAVSEGPAAPDGYILLDATWQQAQKMYNQSAYLHALPKWQLHCAQPSQYRLRRNQRQQGWCTAELIALLWQYLGAEAAASDLTQRFGEFNQR